MVFNPNIKNGDVLTNDDICRIFKCSSQGGMRRSLKTNSLVIVSDHTKSIYEDRWEDDIFHYTGMGLHGNQSLSFAQNKTLNESHYNGVDLFLFEVFSQGQYIFQGRIMLAGKPYIEKQPDENQQIRDVWIFPLKCIDQSFPPLISEDDFQHKNMIRERKAKKLSDEKLWDRIRNASPKSGVRNVVSKQYDRNQDIGEYAKRRANGYCQLCNTPAPFKNKNGEPYLETHHIKWLSNGGADSIDNTVALCPNCHRKMHVLDLKIDKTKLLKKVRE